MIKKNFNRILFIINSLLLFILLVSYGVPMIHPSYLWQISLLGIIFPLVLALNIMFAIYWLFSWKKYFWANLIIILFGTSHIDNIIANQKNKLSSQEFNDIKVNKKHQFDQLINIMTYNVRLFNQNENINNNNVENEILDIIKNKNPKILCLQEFNLTNKTKELFGFYNIEGSNDNKLQIFTKYDVLNVGFVESINSCLYKDIILNDTIRVYNIHLQSNWVKTMKSSYINRANESKKIKDHINSSPFPVIICGDFNDTPISYTYSTLEENLADAFKESGIGIGNSYVGIPSLRIDYILHDKKFNSYNYKKNKYELSDHFPISCSILIP
jgi:endonuclease/exonuclease/phosphatase family metal-dependent hydrolase